MKTKLYILTFFILLSGVAFGQDNNIDSLEVKRIDSIVARITNEINSGSLQKSKIRSSLIKKSKNKSKQKIVAYLRNNEIAMITSSENGSTFTYYIDKEEMIYKSYLIIDNSRPSSCGLMSVTGSSYHKDKKIIVSQEKPLGYNPCPVFGTKTISFEEIYEYVKSKNKN